MAAEEDTIKGKKIQAGRGIIWLYQLASNCTFKDPNQFDLDHFAGGEDKGLYLPFG